jgi:hypothetical protein
MQDLDAVRAELARQGKLSALQSLSETPEAKALREALSPESLSDPEQRKAALERMLQSREGRALAQKIRDAMNHG